MPGTWVYAHRDLGEPVHVDGSSILRPVVPLVAASELPAVVFPSRLGARPHVASGFCLMDREFEGRGAGVGVAGLALRSAEGEAPGRQRSCHHSGRHHSRWLTSSHFESTVKPMSADEEATSSNSTTQWRLATSDAP